MVFSDGREQRCRIEDVFGGTTRPASPAQVKAKFRANAALCLDAAAIAGLEDAIDTLADHATARLGVHLVIPARQRLLRSKIMMQLRPRPCAAATSCYPAPLPSQPTLRFLMVSLRQSSRRDRPSLPGSGWRSAA